MDKLFKSNYFKTIALSLCLCLFTGTALVHITENVSATVMEVGPGKEYETINSALENATDGDVILIHEGVYHENLLVDKQLEIRGTESTGVIIDGSEADTAVNVIMDGVIFKDLSVINAAVGVKVQAGNVHVENCHISYTDNAVILYDVSGGAIHDVTISNTEEGILIWYSKDAYISGITVTEPEGQGIRLTESEDIVISECIVTDPGYHPFYVGRSTDIIIENSSFTGGSHGLFLYQSQNIALAHNHIARGIGIRGDSLMNFDSHSIENNTVDGGGIYYLQSINGIRLFNTTGQIILVNVTESIVHRSFSSHLETGMIVAYSHGNLLVGNTIENNFEGMRLFASTGNTLHHNNIINNTRQIYSPDNSSKENTWTDGLGDGNHWSDYHGTDDGSSGGYAGDGVGDTDISHPFEDKGGGYHRLDPKPLMNATSTMTISVSLNAGWNFVSIGLVTPSHQVADVLESVDGKYDKLLIYEEQNWVSFANGRAEHFNDVSMIDRTTGFWLHMIEPKNLTVTGTTPARTEILLNKGWNMVGTPSNTVVHGNSLPQGVTITGIYNGSMEYMLEYHGADEVEYLPNHGYWLKVDADGPVIWNVVWDDL